MHQAPLPSFSVHLTESKHAFFAIALCQEIGIHKILVTEIKKKINLSHVLRIMIMSPFLVLWDLFWTSAQQQLVTPFLRVTADTCLFSRLANKRKKNLDFLHPHHRAFWCSKQLVKRMLQNHLVVQKWWSVFSEMFPLQ